MKLETWAIIGQIAAVWVCACAVLFGSYQLGELFSMKSVLHQLEVDTEALKIELERIKRKKGKK